MTTKKLTKAAQAQIDELEHQVAELQEYNSTLVIDLGECRNRIVDACREAVTYKNRADKATDEVTREKAAVLSLRLELATLRGYVQRIHQADNAHHPAPTNPWPSVPEPKYRMPE